VTLSAVAVAAAFAEATDEVFIVMLEITHPNLDAPIRVANNTEDVPFGGETFQRFPFELKLPNDDEQAPRAQLTIANVDRVVGNTVLKLTPAPEVRIIVVLASQPDITELDIAGFVLANVEVDAMTVTADLISKVYDTEPWPFHRATKDRLPGLHR
jgi:hypothetical protein